jgi:ABC-2 type transport system permease protein
MKTLVFAARNRKEILRDPLNLAFALGFPLTVLFLLSAIQANLPQPIFPINTLVPGIAVFGLSFISLFSGMLIAKDRGTSFLVRLMASPLKASDFIFGYVLPLIPLSVVQSAICLSAGLLFGLEPSIKLLLVLVTLVPTALLFIAIGLLAGTLLNDKQVGGICGALLTNLSAWFSGTWFDLDLVGGTFKKIAYLMPFAHAVDAGKAALAGDYGQIMPHLAWVLGYVVVIMTIAIVIFRRKMKNATM